MSGSNPVSVRGKGLTDRFVSVRLILPVASGKLVIFKTAEIPIGSRNSKITWS